MTRNSKEILTDTLYLRQFSKDDLDAYARITGDHEVGKWFPNGEGHPRQQAERSLNSILEHWSRHGYGIWTITRKDGVLLGRCELNLISGMNG